MDEGWPAARTYNSPMLERFLILWLCLLCAIGYFWTDLPGEPFDPFTASRPILPGLIALIMFVVGTLLPRDELGQVARRWPLVLFGTAVQYTAMPLLAWSLGRLLLGDNDDALVGIVMVGCVPGAMASNVLTLVARGNVSYSVSLTTAATLLSPVVVPTTLYLLLRAQTEIDPVKEAVSLVLMVVGPVLLGHGLCRWWGFFAEWMKRIGPAIAHLSILWVIAAVVGINRDRLGQAGSVGIVALLAVNLGGYAAGYLAGTLAQLPEPMRRALTIEIGMQNAGLGTTLALLMCPDRPATAILPAFYTFGCMLTGTLLAQVWSRIEPKCDGA